MMQYSLNKTHNPTTNNHYAICTTLAITTQSPTYKVHKIHSTSLNNPMLNSLRSIFVHRQRTPHQPRLNRQRDEPREIPRLTQRSAMIPHCRICSIEISQLLSISFPISSLYKDLGIDERKQQLTTTNPKSPPDLPLGIKAPIGTHLPCDLRPKDLFHESGHVALEAGGEDDYGRGEVG